jgi:general secretion pathway protein E
VRSQAAARYDASPAEVIAAAGLPHPKHTHRKLDEDTIAECIAKAAGLPYQKIDPLKLDGDLITKTFSRPFVKRNIAIPLKADANSITLAIADPFDSALRETLREASRKPLAFVIASKRDILAIIDRVYGFRDSVSKAKSQLGDGTPAGRLVQMMELRSTDEIASSNDENVTSAVDYLLNYAFEQRASDIHIEPRLGDAVVRFRIDGILHDIEVVPLPVHAAITSRVKVLAGMNIAERRRPQDGRIKTQRGSREVELRVASISTAFGEKVVVRVFDPTVLVADLGDLGFSAREREIFERWITSPSGLILVTGPTGSGKTTTLYSTLRYLAGPELNITTVEDPIEMVDPRFCQIQVQSQISLSFATALRAILRQDPDVVMIGEIRDLETAQIAVQASLTGHLVLATLHTNDAASAVTRLADMGVEPYLLSSSLLGVLAQRLVRTLCAACRKPATPGNAERELLGSVGLPSTTTLHVPVGCDACNQTGYRGRTGIYELIVADEPVRRAIHDREPESALREAAVRQGAKSLRADGARWVAHGTTSLAELVRVTRD